MPIILNSVNSSLNSINEAKKTITYTNDAEDATTSPKSFFDISIVYSMKLSP